MDDGKAGNQTVAPWVLVAESEPISRTSLSDLLREEGYQVVEAADSGTALIQLNRDPSIEVILSDLEMPSWATIVKHARSQMPETFILGMVRYGALANAVEAQRLGAHNYLVKPLTFAEVNKWIQRFLTGQSLIKA
jgi:DNA-binding NtrC family response regulator